MAKSTPKAPLDVLGRTGLQQSSGYLFDEWDTSLQGARGRRAYREMADQDPVAGAILYALEQITRQVAWTVQPASDDPQALEIAAFVETCIHDMEETWQDTLAEILTCLVYGWAYHELLYKRRSGISEDPRRNSPYTDNKVGWRSWAPRSQESLQRWDMGDEDELLGMYQIPAPTYVMRYIPYNKALLFRPTVRRGNPEGRSLLRNAYKDYYYVKHLEALEAIGAERDLAGLPLVRVPQEVLDGPDTDESGEPTAKQDYYNLATRIRQDEEAGVVLPSTMNEAGTKYIYDLELITSGGAKQFNTDTVITRHKTSEAQTVLADFLMLGHTARGTQALGGIKVDLFYTATTALLDAICEVPNRRGIPQLVEYNGFDRAHSPFLHHGDIQHADLVLLAQLITALAAAGAQLDLTLDSPLLRHILEEAGLPVPAATEVETTDTSTESENA